MKHIKLFEEQSENVFVIDQTQSKEVDMRTSVVKITVTNNGKTYNVADEYMNNGRDRDTFTIKWNKAELERLIPGKSGNYTDRSISSGDPQMDWYNSIERLETDLKRIGKIEYKI